MTYRPGPATPLDFEQLRRYVQDELNRLESYTLAHVNPDGDPHEQYLLKEVAAQIFAFSAYGGMFMATPTGGPNLGGGYYRLTLFDTLSISSGRGITFTPATGLFSFDNEGVYALSVSLIWEHNSSNSGRLTNLRLWNDTDSAQAGLVVIGTGRNQEATSFAGTLLVEVGPTDVGDEYALELGGGDAYTSVQYDTLRADAWNVGEWKGTL